VGVGDEGADEIGFERLDEAAADVGGGHGGQGSARTGREGKVRRGGLDGARPRPVRFAAMSSDTYYVRVKKVQGVDLVLDVLTSTAGAADSLSTSRSFALLAIESALHNATDLLRARGLKARAEAAEAKRLHKRMSGSALAGALEGPPFSDARDWFCDAAWMKAHVGEIIERCVLASRRNDVGEKELDRREIAIQEEFDGLSGRDYFKWQPRRWAECHNYTLHIRATDPKWLAHLEEGLEYGTTGWDVWPEAPPKAKKPARAPKSAPAKAPRRAAPAKKAAAPTARTKGR
jgi:hypothetical protein